jgi:hypothetical protein
VLLAGSVEEDGYAHAVKATCVDFSMTIGLEGIQNRCAVIYVRGADLFFAFTAEGHASEDYVKRGFGRHVE